MRSTEKIVGGRIVWGAVTWAVFAALVMPLWLRAVGSPASPPFPNSAMPWPPWHLVYGVMIGGVSVVVKNRL